MTYAGAIQFLYGLQVFGAHFGLERTRQLAARFGQPQEKLRFIHVAGTNGKGSTCAMLESIYRAAGLRVGLFTSPHLVSFRERLQVNRQLISEADVARLAAAVAAAAGILPAGDPGVPPAGEIPGTTGRMATVAAAVSSSTGPGGRMPRATSGRMPDATLFEVVTVMALQYFVEQQCDLVIWETGLGGRLDATNIVTPLASVITNIAFDHMQWLGDTLGQIAAEKAGIIKPGIPVVTAADDPEALAVIEETAREKNAPLIKVDRTADNLREAGRLPVLRLPGEHQQQNARLALATVGILQKRILVSPEQIETGLKNASWPGRLQLVQKPGGGSILLDGAHNVAGADALKAALKDSPAGIRPVFILGALADKDWPEICRRLAPLGSKIVTVPVASPRSAAASALAAACRAANPAAEVVGCPNVGEALAKTAADPWVVVTGSLYLVGEALELLGWSPGGAGERSLNEWAGREPTANKSS